MKNVVLILFLILLQVVQCQAVVLAPLPCLDEWRSCL